MFVSRFGHDKSVVIVPLRMETLTSKKGVDVNE